MKAKLAALVLAGSLLGGASTASAGLLGLFGSSPIDVVQEGVLPDYSKTKKVGPALESYYDCQKGSAEWDTFETEKGETIVQFKCALGDEHLTYMDKMSRINSKELGQFDRTSIKVDIAIAMINIRQVLDGAQMSAFQDWQKVNLNVQFAMSQVEEDAFEISYVGLEPTYVNGEQGAIPLTFGTLQGVFEDANLFEADFVQYSSIKNGVADFIGDAIDNFCSLEYI